MTAPELIISEPGVYPDMPDHVYHRDPVFGGSLSSTGARKLLPPSCPALFRHWLDHGQPSNPAFDIGHGAHELVLGVGGGIREIDAADYKTKAAREARDAAYAAGQTPLLPHEHEQVKAMAAVLREHPIAGALLDPTTGDAEQTLVWVDDETGVWCRARLDFLRNRAPGRTIVVDYKTTTSADPDSIRKSVHSYGYHQQDPWYLDGVVALGVDPEPAFVFVFQAKTAPYLVTVVELDEPARAAGRAANRRARQLYAECSEACRWPGYSSDIELISLPPWAAREEFPA